MAILLRLFGDILKNDTRAVAPSSRRRLFSSKSMPHKLGQQHMTDDAAYKEAINILNQYQSRQPQPRTSPSKPKYSPRERTKDFLRLLGHNVDYIQLPAVIHIAGTKGKGTTCHYVNRILIEHQKATGNPEKIGCLTSPHQIDVRERILINNKKISKALFSHYVRELNDRLDVLTSTDVETPALPKYPGFLSLLAIYIFILEKIDVAILETGIGGETDSTNVFPRPVATGITTIGLDHVDTLGHSVEEIAWHKAGIFKAGSLAGTVPQDSAVLQVIRARAEERHVKEIHVVTDRTVLEYGVKVDPDMPYQRYNASLAIFLAEAYLKHLNPHFSMNGALARSLEDVELLGKSQVVTDGEQTWFISSSHNDISLKETVSWFRQSIQRHAAPRILIFN